MSSDVLSVIPRLIPIVFLAIALTYVLLRPSDGSNVKLWLILGLSLFLLLQFTNLILFAVITRFVNSSGYSMLYSIYGIFSSLVSMVGFSFLIAAALTGRRSIVMGDGHGAGVSDDNPYTSTPLR